MSPEIRTVRKSCVKKFYLSIKKIYMYSKGIGSGRERVILYLFYWNNIYFNRYIKVLTSLH